MTEKLRPDESNRAGIQEMLRACFDWGVANGYIVFDVQGVPQFVGKPVATETEISNATTA